MPSLREVYDRIAPDRYNLHHWTRYRPELESLAARWGKGRLLALGCGHGAELPPFRDNFELYGLDFSSVMLEFTRKYAGKMGFTADLFQGDVGYLPFSDSVFDWATSVATYHHIKGEAERRRALDELRRVLKPGGEAFITVWNRWQPWWGGGRGLNTRWFRSREGNVPWQSGEETLWRYYYFFSYPELEKLVRQSGFRVLRSFPEHTYSFPVKFFSRNICLLVKKGS